jgi:hypothetical protein
VLTSERCEETAVDAPSAAGRDRDEMMQDPAVEGMITIESNAHCSGRPKEQETRAVSMSAEDDIEGWGTIILSILVGLLALWFFFAMGGLFALVGPWMIFAASHLVRQKRVRKAGGHLKQQARELVASLRSHATWKILSRNERALFTQSVLYKPVITTSNSTGALWPSPC